MSTWDKAEWDRLLERHRAQSALTQVLVRERYWAARQAGKGPVEALQAALDEVLGVLVPSGAVMADGAAEYEEAIAGRELMEGGQ